MTAPSKLEATDLIRQSGLFDADWYRETYPDIAESGIDPVLHYVASGAFEGRNPNPFFDSAWYLADNADVRAAGTNPLLHFILSGAAEGRRASPLFDTAFYAAENPEVEAAGLNPLYHYLHNGHAEGRSGSPFDEAEAFETGVRAKQQGLNGAASALYRGRRAEQAHFGLPARSSGQDGLLPLPPLRLAQRVGSDSLADFDGSGAETRNTIVRVLPANYDWNGKRWLDFGSGVGRTLRHFDQEAARAEFWGCDVDGSSIRWSVRNLSPPFRFFQIGEVPTIPFEDESFDAVYAVSALGRDPTTWHQWLMEIRRILKPDGLLFLAFMGKAPMEDILGESYSNRGPDFGMLISGPHQNRNEGGPMIFVSPDWIQSFWGSLFDIDYIAMDGLMEYQSFCVMRKPIRGAPIKTDAPVLHLSTTQVFNRDAVGRIIPQIDQSLPYRESYGLHVRGGRAVPVSGWIVFRGDSAESIEIIVDGQRVESRAEFDRGPSYRDWAGSSQTAFHVTVNLSRVEPGQHRLQARIRSCNGITHALSIPLLIR